MEDRGRQRTVAERGSASRSTCSGSSSSPSSAVPSSAAASQQLQQHVQQQQQQQQQHQHQHQQQQQQQQQHLRPLLRATTLSFRSPELERAYWRERCEQLVLLDGLVAAVNLLVLLSVGASSTSDAWGVLLVHAASLVLLAVQAGAMLAGPENYCRLRPHLMVLQRLCRTLLRLQHLHGALPARPRASAAAGSAAPQKAQAARSGSAAPLRSLQAAGSSAAAAAAAGAGAAAAAGSCLAAPAQSVANTSAPAAGSPAWRAMGNAALLQSGVLTSWAQAWAYQASFGALLLQLPLSALAAAAGAPQLATQLCQPALQQPVASAARALSAASGWLLLPLVPQAAGGAGRSCPSLPGLPLALWLQLFLTCVAPAYVARAWEHSSKVWWWLHRLSRAQSVPSDVADEAQEQLQQVRLGLRSWIRHALRLLLLAALCWQACELTYWVVPDAWLAWVRSTAEQ